MDLQFHSNFKNISYPRSQHQVDVHGDEKCNSHKSSSIIRYYCEMRWNSIGDIKFFWDCYREKKPTITILFMLLRFITNWAISKSATTNKFLSRGRIKSLRVRVVEIEKLYHKCWLFGDDCNFYYSSFEQKEIR